MPKLDQTPPDVPVFSCIVYISGNGKVEARVANLTGIEATGSNQRDVLAKIIPAFKARVAELMQRGEPIPWLDPPVAIAAGEKELFIPVHL